MTGVVSDKLCIYAKKTDTIGYVEIKNNRLYNKTRSRKLDLKNLPKIIKNKDRYTSTPKIKHYIENPNVGIMPTLQI